MNCRAVSRQFALEDAYISGSQLIDALWLATFSDAINIVSIEPLSAVADIGRNQSGFHVVGVPFTTGVGGDNLKPDFQRVETKDGAIQIRQLFNFVNQSRVQMRISETA